MCDVKELIEKLNSGCIFSDNNFGMGFVFELTKTNLLMGEAVEKLELMHDDIERLTDVLVESEARADNLQKRVDALKVTNEEILQETKDSLVRMQSKIDILKSDEPVAWMYDYINSNEKFLRKTNHICLDVNFIRNNDQIENIRPLFLRAQPNISLLTNNEMMSNKLETFSDEEIEVLSRGNKHPGCPSKLKEFARAIEAKVRTQYEQ